MTIPVPKTDARPKSGAVTCMFLCLSLPNKRTVLPLIRIRLRVDKNGDTSDNNAEAGTANAREYHAHKQLAYQQLQNQKVSRVL